MKIYVTLISLFSLLPLGTRTIAAAAHWPELSTGEAERWEQQGLDRTQIRRQKDAFGDETLVAYLSTAESARLREVGGIQDEPLAHPGAYEIFCPRGKRICRITVAEGKNPFETRRDEDVYAAFNQFHRFYKQRRLDGTERIGFLSGVESASVGFFFRTNFRNHYGVVWVGTPQPARVYDTVGEAR